MTTRFDCDPALGSGWREALERRELLLAPLLRYLRQGTMRLSADYGADGEPFRFRCEFNGEDINGERYSFASSNSDGTTAIDDTVARVRRTLTRRHQGAQLRSLAS